jgi:hypothetical protein
VKLNRRPRPGKLKGVIRIASAQTPLWRATIKVGGKSIHLGTYPSKAHAAFAYNAAARAVYGDLAYVNPIPQGEAPESEDYRRIKKLVELQLARYGIRKDSESPHPPDQESSDACEGTEP